MSLLKKLIIVASVAGLVACGGEDSGKSYLRILHASPDAPAVDIYVNNELQLSDIEYQDGTGYLRLPDGNATVELRQAGTDTVVATHVGTLDTDGYYAAIAVNSLADLEINVIEETDVVTDGVQDVRIFHAATGVDAVDLYITAPGAEISTPSLDAVSYLSTVVVDDFADGKYQIRATADQSTDVVYDSGEVSIDEEVVIVAVDSTKGRSPVSLLVWSGASASPVIDNTSELRFVNAIDSASVDMYVDSEKKLPAMAYTSVSGYEVYTPGTKSITVVEEGGAVADATPGLIGALTLERGESYTVIASGDSDDLDNARLIEVTDTRIAEDETLASLRIVNASTDAIISEAEVRIYENGTTFNEAEDYQAIDLTRGDDTDYVPVSVESNYTIDILQKGTSSPAQVSGLDDVGVTAGDIKTYVVIGKSGPAFIEISDKRAE